MERVNLSSKGVLYGNTALFCLDEIERNAAVEFLERNKDNSNLQFIEGVGWEFGLNKENFIDLAKALECYKIASDCNSYYSSYRMFLIYSKDHAKFNILPDKDRELYYLLKTLAYFDHSFFTDFMIIFDDVDFEQELFKYIQYEDPQLDKANKVFLDFSNKIDNNELRLVESLTLIKFNLSQDEFDAGLFILHELGDDKYPEAMYKLACYYYLYNKDYIKAEKHFSDLENLNFYKCFDIYASFLYDKKQYSRCENILKIGINNGCVKCLKIYYDFSLNFFDFSSKSLDDYDTICDLIKLNLINGNIESSIEYLLVLKIIKKATGKEYKIDKDLKDIIYRINECEYTKNKQSILLYSSMTKKIKSENTKHKLQVYNILSTVRGLKDTNENKEKLFKELSEILHTSTPQEFNSYPFFYLGKIYEKGMGIGLEPNLNYSYALFSRSAHSYNNSLGKGSIYSYYSRYKSALRLRSEIFTKILAELHTYKLSHNSQDEDDALCPICFANDKNTLLLPCKHTICSECFDKSHSSSKCPLCRTIVILTI